MCRTDHCFKPLICGHGQLGSCETHSTTKLVKHRHVKHQQVKHRFETKACETQTSDSETSETSTIETQISERYVHIRVEKDK